MKRKIYFNVCLADKFIEEPTGLYQMKIPYGEQIMFPNLLIEYEQIDADPLIDAYIALRKWVKFYYPDKDFMTYYWTLEFI